MDFRSLSILTGAGLLLGGAAAALRRLYAAAPGARSLSEMYRVLPALTTPPDPRPSQADVTGHAHSEPQAPRPGVEAFRKLVLSALGGSDLGIWGDQAHLAEAQSEHNVGQAWDWGQPSDDAAAQLIGWLTKDDDANARRLGIGYFIFQRRMYRLYPPLGYSAYSGADPHTAHVHFSFSRAGALGQTSAYGNGVPNA